MDDSSHGRQQRSTLPAADFTLSYQPTTRCIERAPCSAHMCTTRTTQLRDFMRSQSVTLVQRRDQTRHEEDLAKPVLLLSSLSFSYLGSPLSRPSLSRPLFPTRLTIIDRWRREEDGKELGTRARKNKRNERTRFADATFSLRNRVEDFLLPPRYPPRGLVENRPS